MTIPNPNAAPASAEATTLRIWRECGLPEYFIGNGGTNGKLVEFAKRAAEAEIQELKRQLAVNSTVEQSKVARYACEICEGSGRRFGGWCEVCLGTGIQYRKPRYEND